jgi:sulfide:quinone oxidoreductase
MASILILGGGFGGLITAEKLAASLDSNYQVTLVSLNSKFTFYPALPRVVFNEVKPTDITFDLRAKLTDLKVRFVQAEVLNIDVKKNEVKVFGDDFSGNIHYDYLVIAFGRRLATEKVGGFFEYAHHLLGITAALKFKKAVEEFRHGQIIVGMCSDARLPVPICETAFALARKFKSEVTDKKVSINVVFPETVEDAFGGAKIYRELETVFAKHKINLVTNFSITDISKTEISTDDNKPIKHNLLMLIPPFQGQAMVGQLGEFADSSNYAKVNKYMQVAGLKHTYAVGDITSFSGPKFAYMAVQQANVAAANILSEIKGETPQEVYYHEIATIIEGGADSIYLHYGIWDESLYRVKNGSLWGWAKYIHDKYWQAVNL